MLNNNQYPFCTEFYTVEKSIVVVVTINGEPQTIRIDALISGSKSYSTCSYIKEDITVQPTYPQENGKLTNKPKYIRIWAYYDLPWTNGKSADDVLNQALHFLSERCK